MKVIGMREMSLDACVNEAQHEKIVITRKGKPVVLVVGVVGLDAEQVEFGSSPEFWKLIAKRRRQRTITRSQLEKRVRETSKAKPMAAEQGVAPDAVARKKRSRRRG